MKTYLSCYPCFFTQILKTSALLGLDEQQTWEAMTRFGSRLKEMPLEVSPAANGREIYRILAEISGVLDPYHEIKAKCTQTALALFPGLKKRVKEASDPLFEAIRVAVAGNLIDFGTSLEFDLKEDLENLEAKIKELKGLRKKSTQQEK